ncbi:MAG: hypothetical protein UV08_C0025G0008 [Parcubacteria group bacterium GW2011_GWA2_42_18]|nr:MAG: hypothetical protein UV08_C0025G0008 [Parcubacteria group bacterium GW2011_GWA2_42_18]
MRRKYGISTISLVPWSFGHKGFEKSLDIAEELGLDGIQALPMRGWTLEPSLYARYLDDPWDKLIISFEGAWNSGTVIQALKRRFGFGKEGYPTFLDLYLFGFGRRPEQVLKTMDKVFGWEKYISHKFSNSGYRYLLEINSDNVQIQNYIDYKHGLVWDTYHVREQGMPDWRQLLSSLPAESIKLIHFHPKDKKELAEFIAGKENELTEMLGALVDKALKDCPIIIETRPMIFRSRKSLIGRLRVIRDILFNYIG